MTSPADLSSLPRCVIKSVLNGNTIVIRAPSGNPPPEKVVSLAGIVAPQMGKDAATPSEPFAWEAREALRKLCVGRPAAIRVEYSLPNGREFCTIFVGPNPDTDNLNAQYVETGFVKVRQQNTKHDQPAHLAALLAAEESAKENAVGAWSSTKPLSPNPPLFTDAKPAEAFLAKNKGKTLEAVVERVRNGSSYLVTLLPSRQAINLQLAGVRAGSSRAESDDPVAAEAHSFAESRLLQQNVTVILEDLNPQSLWFTGSLTNRAGASFAVALAQGGYVLPNDHTMASVSAAAGGVTPLLGAFNQARSKRLRVFRDYVPPAATAAKVVGGAGATSSSAAASGPTQGKAYTAARVCRVVSAGMYAMYSAETGFERETRIQLAGVFAPNLKNEAEAPWVARSREFTRELLMDTKKPVTVTHEYSRPGVDDFDERPCVSIRIGNLDLAVKLIESGMATVQKIRHDMPRPLNYDALIAAEIQAKNKKVGIHSGKPPAAGGLNDISASVNKAKQFLPFLTRAPGARHRGIVEHVVSGSRMKIILPGDSVLLTFSLQGVQCPRAPAGGAGSGDPSKEEPFGAEALAFTAAQVQNRSVEVSISGVDRTGTFTGSLSFQDYEAGDDKTQADLAVSLLERGLANTHAYSLEYTPNAAELKRAEEAARQQKLGIWIRREEELRREAERKEAEAAAAAKTEQRVIYVTDVRPHTGTFMAQLESVHTSGELAQLSTLLQAEAEAIASPPEVAALRARGALFAIYLESEGGWFRGRIARVAGSTVDAILVDYGWVETGLPVSAVRALSSSLAARPPLAAEYTLAGLRLAEPSATARDAIKRALAGHDIQTAIDAALGDGDSYYNDAINALAGLVSNATLRVYTIGLRDPTTGAQPVLAFLKEGEVIMTDSINAKLVDMGFAFAESQPPAAGASVPIWLAAVLAAEKKAKANRVGMWEFGDLTPDDDTSFGMTGLRLRR
ncbi:hypothetical protein H696_02359 [Fonticula alba]|uniref:TNase-like domain-containing protein n=1 Tax=Fonticula alba TaxID=691883 RepID=A0A058ZD98_FONAL|nr:hypothetical protein H696_02359 [Fonticula alba]KCV71412.1 hypothetical protein H696_02359 [Fonticula alba]|eukprot:XP_009494535.1 hypothetical protein H696_02359 [Fonticula alba]